MCLYQLRKSTDLITWGDVLEAPTSDGEQAIITINLDQTTLSYYRLSPIQK